MKRKVHLWKDEKIGPRGGRKFRAWCGVVENGRYLFTGEYKEYDCKTCKNILRRRTGG